MKYRRQKFEQKNDEEGKYYVRTCCVLIHIYIYIFCVFKGICVHLFYSFLFFLLQYTPTSKDSPLSSSLSIELSHQEEPLPHFDEDEELDEEDEDLPSFLQNDRSRRFILS